MTSDNGQITMIITLVPKLPAAAAAGNMEYRCCYCNESGNDADDEVNQLQTASATRIILPFAFKSWVQIPSKCGARFVVFAVQIVELEHIRQ